jgi:hypothetical protein
MLLKQIITERMQCQTPGFTNTEAVHYCCVTISHSKEVVSWQYWALGKSKWCCNPCVLQWWSRSTKCRCTMSTSSVGTQPYCDVRSPVTWLTTSWSPHGSRMVPSISTPTQTQVNVLAWSSWAGHIMSYSLHMSSWNVLKDFKFN